MNADYPNLRKYAGYILDNHLDKLAKETIRRAYEGNLPLVKKIAHLTQEQIFELAKKGLTEDILIPLREGNPFYKVEANIQNWKTNSVIVPNHEITPLDITGVYNARKLSFIEILRHYDYTKEEGLILYQEIEHYFNRCIELAYQAYEEIQRGTLKESQDILTGILNNIPVIVTRIDKNGTFLKSIGHGLHYMGMKEGEFVGSNIFDIYPDAENTRKALNGEKVIFQGTSKNKRGETKYFQNYFFPEENGALGFSVDITDQKVMEDKLRENEYFIKQIANATPIIIQVYDRINYADIYSNRHMLDLLGYSSEEITAMGKSIHTVVHPDDMSILTERAKRLDEAKDGEVVESEMRVRNSSGNYRWVMTRTTVFKRTPEGKVWQTLSTSIDTTDKKHAEEALQQQLRIFDTALSNTLDFYYIFDTEGKLLYVNKSLSDQLGKPKEEITGKTYNDLGYPDDLVQLFQNQLRKVIETKAPAKGESSITSPAGTALQYEYIFVPVINEKGMVEAIAGTTHDITDLKAAAEKQYRSIFESSNDAILIYDLNGNLVEVNPAGYNIHGYSYQEMIGLNGKDFIAPEDHELFKGFINETKLGKNYFATLKHIRKDGGILYVEKTGTLFTYKGTPHLLAVVHDLTERKKAEVALKESELKFRTMADSVPVMIWETMPDGNCMYLNKQWYAYTGQTESEALGSGWLSMVHPEDFKYTEETYLHANQEKTTFEILYRLKDRNGNYRWFMDTAHPRFSSYGEFRGYIGVVIDIHDRIIAEQQLLESKERLQLAVKAGKIGIWSWDIPTNTASYSSEFHEIVGVESGALNKFENAYDVFMNLIAPEDREKVQRSIDEVFKMQTEEFYLEFRTERKDNQQLRWLAERGQVFYNEEKNPVRMIGTLMDITETKDYEQNLQTKNEELIKINADLDNFIYTASHDLKSPVSNLEGLMNMVSDDSEGFITEKGKHIIPLVSQSVTRLKTVIQELTEIARIQKDTDHEDESVNMNELYKEILHLSERELVHFTGNIINDFSKAPFIKFSRKNLRSILYNLVSNSIKYSDPDKEGLIKVTTFVEREYVVLLVSDNGLGIPEKQMDKVFTMFKRYHTHVEGTGVGLYIVKRIVENAGGYINVESEEGKGSEFKIYFPS